MILYGKDWTRRDLEARVGRVEQIGGIRRLQFTEGPEAGVEQIYVRTGAGLSFSVLPSRGMDIGLAEYGGTPLCWLSPNGEVHPAYFDDRGRGWLRTAAGGLLMTCGLSQVGAPGLDEGEELGLHGRLHHAPARYVAAEGYWVDDEYEMCIRGQVEEAAIYGAYLRLTRTISSRLGENLITIQDEVENVGFEPVPHMLLYHFNFGFPLMSEHTHTIFPSRQVTPREPELPVGDLTDWQPPQAAYRERVYYHEALAVDEDGMAEVSLSNPHFPQAGGQAQVPVTVRLAWDTHDLPYLAQWKMPGMGAHVLGIEPANCHLEGRLAERERGTLVMLAPGQSIQYFLKFWVAQE